MEKTTPTPTNDLFYKNIQLYCAQKYRETGVGTLQYKIVFTDEDDFNRQKQEIRDKQKLINAQYRRKTNAKKAVDFNRKANSGLKPTGIKDIPPDMLDLVKPLKSSGQNYGVNKRDDLYATSVKGIPPIKLDKQSGSSICLIASSKSGKSVILGKLYEEYFANQKSAKSAQFGKKPISILFSPNMHAAIYNQGHFKDVICCDKLCPESSTLLKQMRKLQQKNGNANNYCIMFDDCIRVRYADIVNDMVLTLRNSNFSSIIALQYDKLLSKQARASVNNLILGFLNTDEAIEGILRSFLSSELSRRGYHNLQTQIDLYRELTKDHWFLLYIPSSRSLTRFKVDI